MNVSEIKLDLFRRLDNMDNKSLEKVYDKIVNLINTDSQQFKDLSFELRDALDKALEASSQGRIFTHEEVTQRTRDKYPNLFR
ncbi:MAG TPA: hypothetical protein VJ855_07745 [Marinilabiliaceae bacterium]|nr:hypothetical protein [Marinilabiliaceae bacterium]